MEICGNENSKSIKLKANLFLVHWSHKANFGFNLIEFSEETGRNNLKVYDTGILRVRQYRSTNIIS